MIPAFATRRAILTRGLGALAAVNLTQVRAATSSIQASQRILVCIYLLGGNDSGNMVVPLDQYSTYAGRRRELAIPRSELLAARNPLPSPIAFHPAMPHVRSLFESGSLAVVANVGSRARGFGHQDVSDLTYIRNGFLAPGWVSQSRLSVITSFPGRLPSHHPSGGGYSSLTLSGHGAEDHRAAILAYSQATVNEPHSFPSTSLGRQLSQIASLLKSGVTSGIRRRVFFAVQPGYDTHIDQLPTQSALLAELSESLQAFYAATVQMGIQRQITTYTDSEFGRSLAPNKTGGTEHGWASHQLVVGGSVLGGRVYGTFPAMDGHSIFRPSALKDQHAATLTAWSGASGPQVAEAFPSLDVYAPTVAFSA